MRHQKRKFRYFGGTTNKLSDIALGLAKCLAEEEEALTGEVGILAFSCLLMAFA